MGDSKGSGKRSHNHITELGPANNTQVCEVCKSKLGVFSDNKGRYGVCAKGHRTTRAYGVLLKVQYDAVQST